MSSFSEGDTQKSKWFQEIVAKKEEIVRRVQTSNDGRQRQTQTITLLDIFKVIDRRSYPYLWKVVVRTVTIMPTTVSCEQCFSCLKHRLHENMLKENAFCFLGMVHRHTAFQYGQSGEEQHQVEMYRDGCVVWNHEKEWKWKLRIPHNWHAQISSSWNPARWSGYQEAIWQAS